MAVTYVLKDTNSDLTGGADFNKEISEGTAAAVSQSISVAASSTEVSRGYTASGVPGTNGATGDYTVEVDVSTANMNIQCSIQVHRVNSSGTVQASSSTTAEQDLAADRTFTLSAVDLGTWATGDRLRVDYRLRNTNSMSANTVGIDFNTANAEVVTPFSAGGPTTVSGDGSSAGVATVTADGEAIAKASGSATGTGTATGDAQAIAKASGTAAGAATATGDIQAIFPADGSSSGTATATADGADASGPTVASGAGSAAGVGTASADGVGIATASGTSAGTAAASADANAIATATGTATGRANPSGVGSTVGGAAPSSRGGRSKGKRYTYVATIDGERRVFNSVGELLDYLDSLKEEKVEEAKEKAEKEAAKSAVKLLRKAAPKIAAQSLPQEARERVQEINLDLERLYMNKLMEVLAQRADEEDIEMLVTGVI